MSGTRATTAGGRRAARRVVVKIGTSSITDESGRIHPPRMAAIARGAAAVERATGATPVLVSSGAGAAGRERLGLSLPLTLPDKQAAAAVGQSLLMLHWERALAPRPVAQLLLSADDVHDRTRYVNAKNALQASLRLGAVPIVNENDSVATQELKLGDNDTLSAWVAYLVDADALLILTDVDGLYDADPRRSPDAQRIDEVHDLDAAARMAGGIGSGRGTGGMATKLRAARIASEAGIETWIAGGGGAALEAFARGEAPGTRVVPATEHAPARKAWLAQQPVAGRVVVDDGAIRALNEGRSLLPRGVKGVEGGFAFGDAVEVVGFHGAPVARGLVNYAHDALQRIAGRHTSEIAELLGAKDFDEVVHRDNLVLLARRP
ncbi:MAG: glutamate 5-kinase [Trueperaceae bacterium]|nr:glutamate 5-kinase [Trueperaceae bacterium]